MAQRIASRLPERSGRHCSGDRKCTGNDCRGPVSVPDRGHSGVVATPRTVTELQAIEDLLTGTEAERRQGVDRLHQLVRRLRRDLSLTGGSALTVELSALTFVLRGGLTIGLADVQCRSLSFASLPKGASLVVNEIRFQGRGKARLSEPRRNHRRTDRRVADHGCG